MQIPQGGGDERPAKGRFLGLLFGRDKGHDTAADGIAWFTVRVPIGALCCSLNAAHIKAGSDRADHCGGARAFCTSRAGLRTTKDDDFDASRGSRQKEAAPVRDHQAKIHSQRNFKLASGGTSDYYLDMRPTTFDPEGANLVADLVYNMLATIMMSRPSAGSNSALYRSSSASACAASLNARSQDSSSARKKRGTEPISKSTGISAPEFDGHPA